MSGTDTVDVGDRGRLVVPAELRQALGRAEGTRLHQIETDDGVVVMTRPQLKAFVRRDLEGLDLVGELLAERRAAASEDRRDEKSPSR